jgi:hypothetical protein
MTERFFSCCGIISDKFISIEDEIFEYWALMRANQHIFKIKKLTAQPWQWPKNDRSFGETLCYWGYFYVQANKKKVWKFTQFHVHKCKIRLYTTNNRDSGLTTNNLHHNFHKPVFKILAKYEQANNVKELAMLSDEKARKIII